MGIILRDLGICHHIKYKEDPMGKDFLKGQTYLKEAVQLSPLDYNAWASLGGTYKDQRNYDKALECYKQGLKVTPDDPYTLGNYLTLQIQQKGDLKTIEKNYYMIQKAIKKRLRHKEVIVDMPWTFFDLGLFNLLLGDLNASFDNYLKGIRFSPDIWMIEATLSTLEGLKDKLEGINYVIFILLFGIIFHPNLKGKTGKILKSVTQKLDDAFQQKEWNFNEPVVIISGGTSRVAEKSIIPVKNNLINAFLNFSGTIISGGSTSGICGIVGDIQERYPNIIRTIGYVPSHIPAHVELDKRYSANHITEGKTFSILEPLQYWYDLMKSGIEPEKVKLIGINGEQIAAFEFRLAIVFGAQVGVIRDSGRAAVELINDLDWEERTKEIDGFKTRKVFKILKNSLENIYNFLTQPFLIDPDIENITKLLIQQRESGSNMFELNFNSKKIDNSIFSGFLSALDSIASKELNVGEIISIKFSKGHLTGGFFTNRDFKIVFLLNKTPSPTLEKKISKYIQEVENELGDHFQKLQKKCRSYRGGDMMNTILTNIFGLEILKVIGFQS